MFEVSSPVQLGNKKKKSYCASQAVSNVLGTRLFGTKTSLTGTSASSVVQQEGGLCGVCCIVIKHCSKLQPFVSCHWCVYASFG